MTLYVIPDLAWKLSLDGDHHWFARSPFVMLHVHYSSHFKSWRWECEGHVEICESRFAAQSAANDWYKAKMAEGLKVATVEELRAAIKEMEQGQ